MKILYLRDENEVDRRNFGYFEKAIDGRFPIQIFDPEQSIVEQFQGIEVVVDPGGQFGSRNLIDTAVAAGVKLWQVTTNGTEHVDVAFFLERELALANSPGPLSAVPLAEHVLMVILCFTKNLHLNRAQDWEPILCEELAGRTVGLIGFGASARAVAERVWPLGMRIIATEISDISKEDQDKYHVDFIGKPSDLDSVLARSDYLSLHLHLNSETRHLIDQRALELMKPTAVLINIARGGLVDEAALVEALKTGQIKGAGLDVFAHEPLDPNSPLLRMDNVIATPHSSAYTPGTPRRRFGAAAENVVRIAEGKPPINLVTTLLR